MTVMRAWALLFWPGALIGLLHTIVDTAGADPPDALAYAGPLLLAASAVPILIGVAHRVIVARHSRDDRAAARSSIRFGAWSAGASGERSRSWSRASAGSRVPGGCPGPIDRSTPRCGSRSAR